jgi:hypothetical protein
MVNEERVGVALGAAVPKTSVDEDGELLSGKGKVGLSGQRKMPSPAGDLVRLKLQFIPRHRRHIRRAFEELDEILSVRPRGTLTEMFERHESTDFLASGGGK